VSPILRQPNQLGTITSSSLNNQVQYSQRASPELTLTQTDSDYNDHSFQFMNDENNNHPSKSRSDTFSKKNTNEMTGNIDDVLANAAVSLVSNFLNENILNKNRNTDSHNEKDVDSLLVIKDGCNRNCASPGSVSIITLSSDSEHDNQEDFDDDDEYFFKEHSSNHDRLRRNNKNRSDSIKKERLSIEQFQSMNQPLNLSFNNDNNNNNGNSNKQQDLSRPKEYLEEVESSVRNETDRMKGNFDHEIIETVVSPAVM